MKLLSCITIFSIFLATVICYLEDYEFLEYENNEYDPFYLENFQSSNENCTIDKLNWCTSAKVNYNCTQDDINALKEEQKIFDKFMTTLQEYEKLKTSRFTIECISKNNIRPVEVKFSRTDNKDETKSKLYDVYLDKITACNNCLNYSIPTAYVDCVLPVREEMIEALLGIINQIKKELTNSVAGYRNKCNNVLK